MKEIDIMALDPENLVDIRDVVIRKDLPKEDRIRDFIRQVKNPYCFKYGDYVIKIEFSDTDRSMEDCLEEYVKLL